MLWGVSGPLFLFDYVAAVAGALAVALSIRTLTGWRTRGEPLTTVELAYLTDRAGLACQVGVAALRRAGAVRRGELSTLSVDGPPPAGSAPLVRALHAALRRPQTWAAVLADPAVGRALRRLVGRLVRDGWLLTPAQRRRIALGTLPVFAVAAVGVTRLVDSAVEGRTAGGPASVAGLLLCCLATALTGWWLCEVPETGSAARRLLRQHRRAHADLNPERRPAWSERGTDELLTGMALFGPRPLLAVDPRFAELVGVDAERTRPATRVPARRR
ncbi:TIGR04222 domain-containing membrane protein [Micromonospora sp. 4G57]|uniref:TIGR04222 domain-containing membrane protein n=1 Tax=Micromonospora sicca TaxID=2202420 RepID=A0ABU5J8F8_9ACTN|nr:MULTISPECIES: TIGR04222 domain-containing membrane protein [unclassified Micromonospora]MDZ5443660.1 TIGR04222 domain-containing membrane protein [Micromonospora sp. 4G57]MDZ5488868.1 TIGR04222 domain-containing membrane protein [Micromonospora sp. 4G53]